MIQLTDTQLTEFFTLVAHFHSFKVQFDNFFVSFITSGASYVLIGQNLWKIPKLKNSNETFLVISSNVKSCLTIFLGSFSVKLQFSSFHNI